jgi:hypothetical protein
VIVGLDTTVAHQHVDAIEHTSQSEVELEVVVVLVEDPRVDGGVQGGKCSGAC